MIICGPLERATLSTCDRHVCACWIYSVGRLCTDAVAELVGIEVGVVSGVLTLTSPALTRRRENGDHALASPTTLTPAEGEFLLDGWFDPIEAGLRTRVRGFIETLLEQEELTAALSRPRYGRQADAPAEADHGSRAPGHRLGHRTWQLTGSFGPTAVAVPRARLARTGRDDARVEERGPAQLSAPARRPPTR